MKFRIAITLILLSTFVLAAQAQSSNCCQIQVGGVQISGATTTVPPSASGPGGTYIPTQTDTYPIACVNSQTGKACNSTGTPNNVVAANGAGANFGGNFVSCPATFQPSTSQASPSSGTAASFTDVGNGFTTVDANGHCVLQNPQPFAISTCIVQACTSTSGGGGCGHILTCGDGEAWNSADCACEPASPIVIDISGNGFNLTNAAGGVQFDFFGTGNPIQMGWTAAGAENAFLALPGADGLVHNSKQLFGNFTSQPQSTTPNGFAALAVYDDPKNGGNGDGVIDSRDAIFSSLRLWIDANHDGISQPEELHTLPSLGLTSISLNYKTARRTDQYGNVFRYRAQVDPSGPTNTGRMAYDVFFVTLGQPTSKNIPRSLIPADAQKCAVPVPTKGGILSSTGSR